MINKSEIQDVILSVFICLDFDKIKNGEISKDGDLYGVYSLDLEEKYTNTKGISLYIPFFENEDDIPEEGFEFIYGQFENGELEYLETFEDVIKFINESQLSYVQWSQECLTMFQEINFNKGNLLKYKNDPNLFWKERGL